MVRFARLSDDVVDAIVDDYREGRTARQLAESQTLALSPIDCSQCVRDPRGVRAFKDTRDGLHHGTPRTAKRGRTRNPVQQAMLDLQRTVGNIAVCSWVRVLQRQPAAGGGVVIGVHLTPAQIAKAHRFYAANRARYSATLISDIQKAVGRPSTGVVDDETIRAVADKQDEFGPPLVPDGMAGSRTLARLFPTGLAGGDTAKRFIASVKEVVAPEEWAKLGTPQARAERLLDLASVQLASARVGVAPTAVAVQGLGPKALTQRGTWEVFFDIGQNHLDQPSISDRDARTLAGEVVYHEARHIEQFHKMARMLAAKEPKFSPEQIAARMEIPLEVARDARDDPLLKGTTEFLIAEDQFDATFGAGKQHEARVQAEVIAAEQELARAKKNGDPGAIRVAEARREQARKEHDALATETDAVLTEQTIFDEW